MRERVFVSFLAASFRSKFFPPEFFSLPQPFVKSSKRERTHFFENKEKESEKRQKPRACFLLQKNENEKKKNSVFLISPSPCPDSLPPQSPLPPISLGRVCAHEGANRGPRETIEEKKSPLPR